MRSRGGGIVIWHLRQMQTQRHGIFVRTRNTTRLLNFIVSLNIVITSQDKHTLDNLILILSLICLSTLNKSFCQSNCLCVLWCDINCGVWRVGYCVLRTPTRVPCHTIPPGLITSTKCKIKSDHDLSRVILVSLWQHLSCASWHPAPSPRQANLLEYKYPGNNGDVTPLVATARHMTRTIFQM